MIERSIDSPNMGLPAGGGIFAVYSPDPRWEDAPTYAAIGARENQARGELVTHMAHIDSEGQLMVLGGHGLAGDVYSSAAVGAVGRGALAHVSHNAFKAPNLTAEPFWQQVDHDRDFTLSFDGAVRLRSEQELSGEATFMAGLVAEQMQNGKSTEDAVFTAVQDLEGAFSLAVLDGGLTVARDKHGVHPLNHGIIESNGVHIFSSEPAALDLLNANHLGEVAPGTIVTVDESGVRTRRFAEPEPKYCSYNFLHTARRGGEFAGQKIETVRQRYGELLAEQDAGLAVDVAVRVPEAASPIALGYARAKGVHYVESALQRNRYDFPFANGFSAVGIDAIERIKASLSVIDSEICKRRVVVVDDSVGVGATLHAVTQRLWKAGATEVHLRIASPPRQTSCHLGGGDGTQEALIVSKGSANQLRKQMSEEFNATSFDFLDRHSMALATGLGVGQMCMRCIGGPEF